MTVGKILFLLAFFIFNCLLSISSSNAMFLSIQNVINFVDISTANEVVFWKLTSINRPYFCCQKLIFWQFLMLPSTDKRLRTEWHIWPGLDCSHLLTVCLYSIYEDSQAATSDGCVSQQHGSVDSTPDPSTASKFYECTVCPFWICNAVLFSQLFKTWLMKVRKYTGI